MSHRFSAQGATWFRNCDRQSLNLIPYLGVDAGESIQVSQVSRSNGDGLTRLAGEGRLASEDRIAVECFWRRRRDTRLSEESPELGRLDHRVRGRLRGVKLGFWFLAGSLVREGFAFYKEGASRGQTGGFAGSNLVLGF